MNWKKISLSFDSKEGASRCLVFLYGSPGRRFRAAIVYPILLSSLFLGVLYFGGQEKFDAGSKEVGVETSSQMNEYLHAFSSVMGTPFSLVTFRSYVQNNIYVSSSMASGVKYPTYLNVDIFGKYKSDIPSATTELINDPISLEVLPTTPITHSFTFFIPSGIGTTSVSLSEGSNIKIYFVPTVLGIFFTWLYAIIFFFAIHAFIALVLRFVIHGGPIFDLEKDKLK